MKTFLAFALLLSPTVLALNCDNGVNYWGPGWDTGRNGRLNIKNGDNDLTSWTIDVTFDSPVDVFNVWDGVVTNNSPTSFTVTNKNYNGVVAAGKDLLLGMQLLFSSGTRPLVSAMSFNGNALSICDDNTLPAPTTTTTTTPAPTPAADCPNSIFYQDNNGWATGQIGDVKVLVPAAISSWTMRVTFDLPVTSLTFWNGIVTKVNDLEWTVTNKHYSGNVNAGQTFSQGFRYNFNSEARPRIASVEFNGNAVDFCFGGDDNGSGADESSEETGSGSVESSEESGSGSEESSEESGSGK